MRRSDIGVGLATVAVGAFFVYESLQLGVALFRLFLGDADPTEPLAALADGWRA